MTSRAQISIYVVLGLLVADFILFGYIPARRQLETMERAITTDISTRRLADVQRRQIPHLRQRLEELRCQLATHKARIPDDLKMGDLLETLAGLMEGRLTARSFVPGQPQLVDGLYRTTIHVSCCGRLADVFEFLQDLARIRRLVVVEQMRLDNDHGLTGQLQVEMDLVVFHEPLGHA